MQDKWPMNQSDCYLLNFQGAQISYDFYQILLCSAHTILRVWEQDYVNTNKKQSRPAWEWGYTVVFGNQTAFYEKNYTKVCLPTKKQWAPHHTSNYPPSWQVYDMRSLLSGIYTNYTTTTHCHSYLLSLQCYYNGITYKCIPWRGNYIISVLNTPCLSRMIHSNKNKPLNLHPNPKLTSYPNNDLILYSNNSIVHVKLNLVFYSVL